MVADRDVNMTRGRLTVSSDNQLMSEPLGWQVRKNAVPMDEYETSSYAEEMRRRLDYYNGDQFKQDPLALEEALLSNYITPEQWKSIQGGYGWSDICAMLPDATEETIVQPVMFPFVKIVVDNLQVVYSVPPKQRTLWIDGEEDEDNTKLMNKVYESAHHDILADQLCKWTGLFYTAFQYTSYDARRKKIVRRNLPPNMVYVIPAPEDPTDIQHPNCLVAVAMQDQGITDQDRLSKKTLWQVWWQDMFWYEESPGWEFRDVACTERGFNRNPYKDEEGNPVKPITVTHAEDSDDIYFEGSDRLVMMNQRLDRDLTALSYTMEYQGFSVPVAIGISPEEMEAQAWAPAAAVCLPDPEARLEFAHPVTQMSEFMETVVKKARAFARMTGVDPDIVEPNSVVQSGVSRAQARVVLSERREEQFPKWLPYERETYWLTAIVWNAYNSKKLLNIPRYDHPAEDTVHEIYVDFGELDIGSEKLTDTLDIERRIDNDLMTRREAIAAERRIKDPAIAEKVASRIAEENAEERKKKMEETMLNDPTTDENGLPRLGQPGNPPLFPDKKSEDQKGAGTTAGSGNNSIPQKAEDTVGGKK